MAIPRGIVAEYPALGEWCILHAWRGIDDKDTIAICVPPLESPWGRAAREGNERLIAAERRLLTVAARALPSSSTR
jgi:hypothetical protein